ncbi:MAG TPA: LysM domain-containing protein [Gaiellaceae bacterium]|nr:LysM domain-containing protein [Gaiellaceae bacterium]
MNRRLAKRLVAPAAFLAGVTIAVLLVRAGLDDGQGTTVGTTVAATTERTTTRSGTTTQAAPKPVFVEVQAGDTLDQIAIDNNTTVERLLTLNPGLDPTGLQVGQQLRVR